MKRVLIAAALLTAGACLVPPLRMQINQLMTVLRHSSRSLATTSFEQRRLAFYGDCDKHGYGYVRRMMVSFPDARTYPSLRNPKWDPRIVPVVLPGFRRTVDDRVLIATGLTEHDAQESRMAHAERRRADARGTEEWHFVTGEEFDLLTGFAVRFSTHPLPDRTTTMKMTLFYAVGHPVVMGEWQLAVEPHVSGEFRFRLPQPLANVTFSRSTLPFLLRVRTTGGRSPTAIDVLGVKVDTRGYVVVNRETECFTAVKRELLDGLDRPENRAWSNYVSTIRNVGIN
jgi:hypothetical protein